MSHFSDQKTNVVQRIVSSLLGCYRDVKSCNEHVELVKQNNDTVVVRYDELVDFPRIERGLLFVRIILKDSNRKQVAKFSRFAPLFAQPDEQLLDFNAITQAFDQTIRVKKKLYFDLAENEYLRDSSIATLEENISPLIKNYAAAEEPWNKYTSNENIAWLESCQHVFPVAEHVDSIRTCFEKKKLQERNSFYDRIESNPLTDEQRLAVIRENDRNMVLAAAGTGKTSVMVAKALDLIDSGQLRPDEILILAYNNDAARELRERLAKRADEAQLILQEKPKISTFHSLGKKVLNDSNVRTHLSPLAEDTKKFDKWVHDWLIDYISSSTTAMKNFIAVHFRPADPFSFKTSKEYEAYIADNEHRALSGDLVKGHQEVLIANWLYLNGIEFEYEAPFVSKVRVEIGHDYRPDFHIKNTHVFIEHFGIDRLGNTRADINAEDYKKGMESKRELHEKYGTALIETFHYDWVEKCLETSLEKQLAEHGITAKPISPEDTFKALNESGVVDNGAKILQKSLQAIRIEQLNSEQVLERLVSKNVPNAEKYAAILNALHDDYVKELAESERIDFDDMIIRASNCVEDGAFKPYWKFVLVDEFQDISGARMNFLRAIINNGPDPKLTVVGDDWQSIYRFSGGKLELTTRFSELVGSNTCTKLQKTFRYNNSIADTAGTFIMENDEQYKKHIKTHHVVPDSQIYVLDSLTKTVNNMSLRTLQIVNKIREKDTKGSIAVLSRYRYLLNEIKTEVSLAKRQAGVKFWTFHSSKGLEADYCILVGFSRGKTGFPNENKDDEVVEALLPTLDSYPHSEERRLMYVGITRAKKKVYIIADPTAPSEFINELLTPKYNVQIASKTFQEAYRKIFKCPSCVSGYFQKNKGKYSEFYSCSSSLACSIKPRVCKSCGCPSIDNKLHSVCTNPECGDTFRICPRCARPMKLRIGKYGKFYGCSGYSLENDQCLQTVPA